MHLMKQPNVDRLVGDLVHGRVDRRELMGFVATAGLAFAALPTTRAAADADMVTYYTWGGYDIPELHQPFIAKYGEPNTAPFGGTEEALAKIRAGYEPDVAHPCLEDMRTWYDANVLAPIDTTKVANWDNIFPQMLDAGDVSFDGAYYMVPFDWGNSSILYRTDLIEVEEESWCMMFDEKYEGRIAARNSIANVRAAAACLGFDMFTPTDEQLGGPIADLLRVQRRLVPFFWDDQTTAEQAVANGEAVMMYAWNSAVVELKKQGLPIAYANPKEGRWTWMCGIVRVVSGRADEQMQYDFIDAMLAPETGKWLIENYGYGHANKQSFEIADPTTLDELGLTDPIAVFERGVFLAAGDPATEAKMVELFDSVMAGF